MGRVPYPARHEAARLPAWRILVSPWSCTAGVCSAGAAATEGPRVTNSNCVLNLKLTEARAVSHRVHEARFSMVVQCAPGSSKGDKSDTANEKMLNLEPAPPLAVGDGPRSRGPERKGKGSMGIRGR